MHPLTIVLTALAVLTVVGAVFLLRPRPTRFREEPLGNPRPRHAEPVVRSESRHHDTPAAADVTQRSGRHDD